MTSRTFESQARNGEDVVLWRALGNLPPGRFMQLGRPDSAYESITRVFKAAGWRGICVTTQSQPRHGSAAGRSPEITWSAHLDTATTDSGLAGLDVHFATVDLNGAEATAFPSIDLRRWRPWILVINSADRQAQAATESDWEPPILAADYQLCLFDGLSRFYVAAEHAATLRPSLSYPACALDNYSTPATRELEQRRDELTQQLQATRDELVRWRTAALTGSTTEFPSAARPTSESVRLAKELDDLHQTISWRVTKPLRTVRSAMLARRSG